MSENWNHIFITCRTCGGMVSLCYRNYSRAGHIVNEAFKANDRVEYLTGTELRAKGMVNACTCVVPTIVQVPLFYVEAE